VAAIATYLAGVHREALRRGYRFDKTRIHRGRTSRQIVATKGQLLYEWKHLMAKLRKRSPEVFAECKCVRIPDVHPLFKITLGQIEKWERRKRR
jgi:hypothetical protein